MIKTYRKGREWEYKVIQYLERKGWLVQRSAKSSFPDIWAIPPFTVENMALNKNRLHLIECKVRGRLNSGEERLMQLFRKKYNAIPILALPKYSVYSSKEDNIILEEKC